MQSAGGTHRLCQCHSVGDSAAVYNLSPFPVVQTRVHDCVHMGSLHPAVVCSGFYLTALNCCSQTVLILLKRCEWSFRELCCERITHETSPSYFIFFYLFLLCLLEKTMTVCKWTGEGGGRGSSKFCVSWKRTISGEKTSWFKFRDICSPFEIKTMLFFCGFNFRFSHFYFLALTIIVFFCFSQGE